MRRHGHGSAPERGDEVARTRASAPQRPACFSAASTARRLASPGQVIGNRSPAGKPGRTRVMAYFTGPGDASLNKAM